MVYIYWQQYITTLIWMSQRTCSWRAGFSAVPGVLFICLFIFSLGTAWYDSKWLASDRVWTSFYFRVRFFSGISDFSYPASPSWTPVILVKRNCCWTVWKGLKTRTALYVPVKVERVSHQKANLVILIKRLVSWTLVNRSKTTGT